MTLTLETRSLYRSFISLLRIYKHVTTMTIHNNIFTTDFLYSFSWSLCKDELLITFKHCKVWRCLSLSSSYTHNQDVGKAGIKSKFPRINDLWMWWHVSATIFTMIDQHDCLLEVHRAISCFANIFRSKRLWMRNYFAYCYC